MGYSIVIDRVLVVGGEDRRGKGPLTFGVSDRRACVQEQCNIKNGASCVEHIGMARDRGYSVRLSELLRE